MRRKSGIYLLRETTRQQIQKQDRAQQDLARNYLDLKSEYERGEPYREIGEQVVSGLNNGGWIVIQKNGVEVPLYTADQRSAESEEDRRYGRVLIYLASAQGVIKGASYSPSGPDQRKTLEAGRSDLEVALKDLKAIRDEMRRKLGANDNDAKVVDLTYRHYRDMMRAVDQFLKHNGVGIQDALNELRSHLDGGNTKLLELHNSLTTRTGDQSKPETAAIRNKACEAILEVKRKRRCTQEEAVKKYYAYLHDKEDKSDLENAIYAEITRPVQMKNRQKPEPYDYLHDKDDNSDLKPKLYDYIPKVLKWLQDYEKNNSKKK